MKALLDPHVLTVTSAKKWKLWLAKNYTRQEGKIIKVARKNSGVVSITTEEALDVTLR
ncbi:hypothetical protein BH11PAT1_BH11PAT1_5290 [soil metagenome]